jgi:hypothetical protein
MNQQRASALSNNLCVKCQEACTGLVWVVPSDCERIGN